MSKKTISSARIVSPTRTTLVLPQELMQRLHAQAAKEDRTVTALVRRFVREGLDRVDPAGASSSNL